MAYEIIYILLLGDEKCGKTTFLSRTSQGHDRLSGQVPFTILRDIDQPFVFQTRSRKATYRLEFSDTSSPESWKLLRPDLVLLCFGIDSRPSLINLQAVWMKEVRKTFESNDGIPVLVLGLKRDLRSEEDPNGTVYPQEAYAVAQEIRADKYMECSAITGELLSEAFEDICTTAVKIKAEGDGQSAGACCLM